MPATDTKTKPAVEWYQLLASRHEQTDPDWQWPVDEQGKRLEKDAQGAAIVPRSKTYSPGDKVPSEVDLVRKFGPDKFMRLTGDASQSFAANQANQQLIADIERLKARNKELEDKAKAEADERGDAAVTQKFLEEMTVKQLREYAEEREIDLEGAHSKADIVAAIQLAVSSR